MGIAETKPARTAVNPRSYEGVLPMRGKEANQQTMSGNPNVQEKQTWIPLKLISGASKLQKGLTNNTKLQIYQAERGKLCTSMPNFQNNPNAHGWGSNATQTPINPKLRYPEAQLGSARGSQRKH
jgi:hypothetical protein